MLASLARKIKPIQTNTKTNVEIPFGWGEGEPPTPDEIIDENTNAEIKKRQKRQYNKKLNILICFS